MSEINFYETKTIPIKNGYRQITKGIIQPGDLAWDYVNREWIGVNSFMVSSQATYYGCIIRKRASKLHKVVKASLVSPK